MLLNVDLEIVDSVGVPFQGLLPFRLPESVSLVWEIIHIYTNSMNIGPAFPSARV
jgi:hypothetical protein